MRQLILIPLVLSVSLALVACSDKGEKTVERAFDDVNVVDETDLNDVMLTVADADEAVNYFQRATQGNAGRIDLQRGLAKSLVRAKRNSEGV